MLSPEKAHYTSSNEHTDELKCGMNTLLIIANNKIKGSLNALFKFISNLAFPTSLMDVGYVHQLMQSLKVED